MTFLADAVQEVRDGFYLKAQEIRNDVIINRAFSPAPGSLAWAVDDFRLAWSDLLVVLSGWAQ